MEPFYTPEQWQHALTRARLEWPQVQLEEADFAAYVQARAAEEEKRGTRVEALSVDELYLCCACAAGDATGLRLFDERYLNRVPEYVVRLHLSANALDEVRQRLRQRLFVAENGPAKILQYTGRVPLEAWLRVVAVRVALNHVGRREDEVALDEWVLDPPSASPNPEADFFKTRHRREFSQALQGALSGLPPEDQTVLRLHYVDGWNVDRLGASLGVHRATAARRVARIREELLRLLKQQLAAAAVDPAAMESFLGDVPSQLDISLRHLLAK